MRNILKGFLKPAAEKYILPDADSILMGEQAEEAFQPIGEEPEERFIPPELEADLAGETPPEPEPAESEEPNPIQYAQVQADLMLQQAKAEAERLAEEARAALQRELEDIRAGARDEGYREGYAQGMAKAMEDGARDREAEAARLEKEVQAFLEKATLAREEMLNQTQAEMLDLCIAVAEKIVRVSLRSSSDVIVRMIQSATERMRRQEWVHIYISGCDTRGIAQISPALTTSLGALSQHIKVVPMGDDESGTCIVETPEEIIDASVSTQLSNIRDLLTEQLGAGWQR